MASEWVDQDDVQIFWNDVCAKIASEAYTLPTATSSKIGGIKYDGETIKANGNGQIYVNNLDGVSY